jgi:uncharacterized protein
MIVYKASKQQFLSDVYEDDIEDIIAKKVQDELHKKVANSEYRSWSNSLPQVEQLLRDEDIPEDAGIAIEYNIPQTQNRVDFIICGQDENLQDHVILIELKQWSKATLTNKDGMVNTRFSHGYTDTQHPSYQAWSYSMLLNSFNVAVYEGDIQLSPCAYLHNYKDDGVISSPFYKTYMDRAPLFCKEDKRELRAFIKKYIKHGDKNDIIFNIENGQIRPSKALADSMVSLLKGNEEFVLIDSQKEIFEEAKHLAKKAQAGNKQVLIVEGGPGTGKSVVAINLLVSLTNLGLVSQYVTRNSAPRTVYEAKLTKSMKKSVFSNMFKGSGAFHDTKSDCFDALIVDEAHRLNHKSGMFGHLGESQTKEIINSSLFSIFFIDENQRVTLKDVGSKEEIEKWANHFNAEISYGELESQFRCSGSDGYLSWIDNSLQIRQTANPVLGKDEYDFKVYDNPNDLKDRIYELNKERNSARIVAGYCWKWVTKTTSKAWRRLSAEEQRDLYDIVIPEYDFKMKWNLDKDGMLYLINPESVSEVGCIHTCQGLELDYVGVIIGDDFVVRNGVAEINPSAHPGMDKALHTWRAVIAEDPVNGKQKVDTIIKNTYRTLMSRGMKGCYIYCTDKETSEYFKGLIN